MAAPARQQAPAAHAAAGAGGPFDSVLERHGLSPLVRAATLTLQVNVGKRCNQACHHCHVEAGPKRTEIMPAWIAGRVIDLLAASPAVEVLDLTGGAPELNPSFRFLVREARRLGRRVIDRCNLTVLLEPGMEDLGEFLADHGVEVIASLPCYGPERVDEQRGQGTFAKSIDALRLLNDLGYGHPGSPLILNLVYNPVGAFLPPAQEGLETTYRDELGRRFDIAFHRLFTLTNMPIKRFAQFLERTGQREAYMSLLVNHFNPATVPALMCRTLVSVGWNGVLYDCDFNQMLELGLGVGNGARTIWGVDSLDTLAGYRIATGPHCFGCAAGAGSSCGGSLQ
jgi:radical SAM/Cys-rich protein